MASIPVDKISALPAAPPISSPPQPSGSNVSFQEHLRRSDEDSAPHYESSFSNQASATNKSSPNEGDSDSTRNTNAHEKKSVEHQDDSVVEKDQVDLSKDAEESASSEIVDIEDETEGQIGLELDLKESNETFSPSDALALPVIVTETEVEDDVSGLSSASEAEVISDLQVVDVDGSVSVGQLGSTTELSSETEPNVRSLSPESTNSLEEKLLSQSESPQEIANKEIPFSPVESHLSDTASPSDQITQVHAPRRRDVSVESDGDEQPFSPQIELSDTTVQPTALRHAVATSDRALRREIEHNKSSQVQTVGDKANQAVQASVEAIATSDIDSNSDSRESSGSQTSSSTSTPISTDGETSLNNRLPHQVLSRIGERGSPSGPITEVDQGRFVQRVAKAFEAAQNRDGEIRLRLSPPELGSLRLELKVEGGVMTVRIEAETATAQSLLLDNMSVLRERLAEQGVRVEQFDVDLMDRQPDGLPEDAQQKDKQDSQGSSKNHSEPSEDAQANLHPDFGDLSQGPDEGRLNVII